MLTYMFWITPGDRALYLRGNISFLSLLAVLMHKSGKKKPTPDPTCYEPSNLRANHNLPCTMKETTLFHAMIPHGNMNNENRQSCSVNRKRNCVLEFADCGSVAFLSASFSLPHSSRGSVILVSFLLSKLQPSITRTPLRSYH